MIPGRGEGLLWVSRSWGAGRRQLLHAQASVDETCIRASVGAVLLLFRERRCFCCGSPGLGGFQLH